MRLSMICATNQPVLQLGAHSLSLSRVKLWHSELWLALSTGKAVTQKFVFHF